MVPGSQGAASLSDAVFAVLLCLNDNYMLFIVNFVVVSQ